MKTKLILMVTAVLLVAAAIVGGSLAATSASGQKVTADLAAPTLQASITGQPIPQRISLENEDNSLMPGDKLGNVGFTIENTAEVPLYAKVTVTKYWQEEEIEARDNTAKDANLIGMDTDVAGWLQANDVLSGNSGETEVFYLAYPLQPGEAANLNLNVMLDNKIGNDYQILGIVIEGKVEAVQFVSGQNNLNADGILSTFGVIVTLNGDGSIQSVVQ